MYVVENCRKQRTRKSAKAVETQAPVYDALAPLALRCAHAVVHDGLTKDEAVDKNKSK